MASYMVFPANALVHRISPDLAPAHAAFAEPLACSLHAVERADVRQGLNLLRKRGTFLEYSVFAADVTVDWTIISDDKELDVRGAHLGPHCWPAAVRLIESGALPLEGICSHQLPLAEFQRGLDLVADGSESIKVTLLPEQ